MRFSAKTLTKAEAAVAAMAEIGVSIHCLHPDSIPACRFGTCSVCQMPKYDGVKHKHCGKGAHTIGTSDCEVCHTWRGGSGERLPPSHSRVQRGPVVR